MDQRVLLGCACAKVGVTNTQKGKQMKTTFRLILLGDDSNTGQTAATPELAKLVPGGLAVLRANKRLAIEQTDWEEHFDKMRPRRSVVIDAEPQPGEWKIGP